MLHFVDARELADEIRRLFDQLAHGRTHVCHGECTPGLDIVETSDAIEITVDLPGVSNDAVRVVIRNDVVLIAGEKAPPRPDGRANFHLVERAFGRFARAIRAGLAIDTRRAHATLQAGELRIVLPKIPERRGRQIEVAIEP